jgi:hypothetical protein
MRKIYPVFGAPKFSNTLRGNIAAIDDDFARRDVAGFVG